MRLISSISGKYINLRTAEPSDAEFILSLRLDEKLSRYLKPTDPSVVKQKIWIAEKIKQPNDYHMIIELKDGKRLGVVALYDINNDVFEWGRWLIVPNSPIYVLIESCFLVYDFAFNTLGLNSTKSKVRKSNKSVLKFHLNYGADIQKEDDKYVHITYHKNDFNNPNTFLKKYLKTIAKQ
jgi:RimJ/RimL family protein N-acetyltransferase